MYSFQIRTDPSASTVAGTKVVNNFPSAHRLESIDILRGLLMVLMALDHTRDFFSSAQVDPGDPATSWPALFATRWVTHLCAPGFIALAGASVSLQRERGKSAGALSRLLSTRGLWLVLVELTVIDFAWFFTVFPFLQVIWAIGICMMLLACLQKLPTRVIGALGAIILLGHNLLDPIQASHAWGSSNLWDVVHVTNLLMLHGHPIALVLYPVLPWFGFMCVGYAFGPIAVGPPLVRRRVAAMLGTSFLAAFAVLRIVGRHGGGYGDSYHWQHLGTAAGTAMSFLQVQKYPPSLEYALVTLGCLLFLYLGFDVASGRNWLAPARSFLAVFGRVPFFYYVLHLYLLHGTMLLLVLAFHMDWRMAIGPQALLGHIRPPGWGYLLPGVYAFWLGAVLVLYLPCRWFSQVKARRRDWWLSYL